MVERILIVAAAVLAGVILVKLWGLWQQRRLSRLADESLPPSLSERLDQARLNLLYFTADHCAQCRLQQAPILSQLSTAADIQVLTIDAVAEADLARHFGVMTVPTTVVLDRARRPAAVNHGLAYLPQLQQQLTSIAA